jgi:4-amino-4-deoxy-L-arabinose transferase-like glycosyltransferase
MKVINSLLKKEAFFYSFLWALAFLIVSFLTLRDYGINEDSPGHFLRGQAYFQLLFNHQERYNQPKLLSPVFFVPGQRASIYKPNSWEQSQSIIRSIPSDESIPSSQSLFNKYQAHLGRHSFYEHNAWSGQYFMNSEGAGHPPVSDILAAGFNRLFYQTLNWVGDIESYHLYVLFTAALAIFFVSYFCIRLWSKKVAFFAIITLAFYPIFFAESHFNIKDIPELSFFTLSIISFYFWVKEAKIKWFIIFTLAVILAVGTKLNSLFLPFILLPWLFSISPTLGKKGWVRILAFGVISLILVIAGFFMTWPYLWGAPLERFIEVLSFYKGVGNVDLRIEQASWLMPFLGFQLKGLVLIVITMPLMVLGFVVLGLISFFTHRKRFVLKEQVLLILWLVVPILRVLRPGAEVFDSTRQFIEFLPALTIIAGLGGGSLITFLSHRLKLNQSYLISIVGVIYLISLLFIIISFHPNQNLYFNSLIGGPQGAYQKGLLSWQSSYSNPYRQTINWINQNSEDKAKLAFLDGTMVAIPPIWLRQDILFGSNFSGFEKKGEYIMSLVYPDPPKVFPYLYLERFLEPAYEAKVDGVSVAKVWKNDLSHTKVPYRNSQVIKDFSQTKGSDPKLGPYWQVDLGGQYQITSLEIEVPLEEDCSSSDGLFLLDDYIVPQRVDQTERLVKFSFPASKSQLVRFYGITDQSCLLKGTLKNVTALD